MFELKIRTDNAAFEDGAAGEVARILRGVADRLEYDRLQIGIIRDIHGNDVGRFRLSVGE